jgi:hypothetical protein
MSRTNDAASATQRFYICELGDGAIGYDGCGAIDFEHSDLLKVIVASGPKMATRYAAYLAETGETKSITMRRAVRPFEFYYDYRFNSLLVSTEVRSSYQAWIDLSAVKLESVVCHFGKKSADYYFGNLKHAHCLADCIWSKSSFATVYTSDFDINRTRIGRWVVPLDHEVSYTARGQIFTDIGDHRRSQPSLHMHVPERLAFAFPFQDILNIGIGKTLISERLFEALWSRHRPKSRVLGITGSRPLVEVEFEAN